MPNLSTSADAACSTLAGLGQQRLSASLMCADFAVLEGQLGALERAGVRRAHLDFGDGRFVRNLPLGVEIFAMVPPRTGWSRECHLMLSEPYEVLHLFTPHCDLIFFHFEASSDPFDCAAAIRDAGVRPGIALNPATPLQSIVDLLPEVGDILVMAVEPGFAGGPFVEGVVEKVRRIRALADAVNPGIRIEIDGAVSARTIPSLVDAGADRFVGGSSGLFVGGDLEASARSLIDCIESALARRRCRASDAAAAGEPTAGREESHGNLVRLPKGTRSNEAAPAIGVDIGATRCKLALVAGSGAVLESTVLQTPRAGSGQEVVDKIADAVVAFRDEVAGAGGVQGFGIAVPNFVVGSDWVQKATTNLPEMEGLAMRPLLAARLRDTIAIANDVSAAATAEHLFGRGRGRDRVLLISVGTGISIGAIVDGELLQYLLGTAGDTGHIIVDTQSRLECSCGGHGCLETVASATGIRNEAIRAVQRGEQTGLRELVQDESRLTAESIAAAARGGDAVAKRIFERASFSLGIALTTYVHMFAPELIVFAGGVSGSMDLLQDGVRATLERFANPSLLGVLERIELSAFPELGAAIGSAGLILFPGRYLRSSYRWRAFEKVISHA